MRGTRPRLKSSLRWPHAVVAVRTAIDPKKMLKTIAAIVDSLDPDLPLGDIKTGDQLVRDEFGEDRFGIALYAGFAGIALLLASLGIYGVMSFAVAQSTSEIGVRMALGATPGDVLRRVLKDYADDPQFLQQPNGRMSLFRTRLKLAAALRGEKKFDDANSLVEELLSLKSSPRQP